MTKGKTREKLMKCELNQQIGHCNVSIPHEAAKIESDFNIIRLCETLDLNASEAQCDNSCYLNYTCSVATLQDMKKDPIIQSKRSNPRNHNPNQNKFKLIKADMV